MSNIFVMLNILIHYLTVHFIQFLLFIFYSCATIANIYNQYWFKQSINIKNLYTKEKVFFRSNKAYYFSHKDNIKKSAELIGLIKIKKNKVKFIKKILLQINNKHNNYKFCDLLKKINKKTFI